jgi:ferric iron reductase protein FhuF
MDGQRTDRPDVATSLFVQGYVFRIATVAIGSWLLADAVLDVAPQRTAIALGSSGPNAVNLTVPFVFEDAAVVDVHAALVDGHFAPLVDVARRSCRVGETLLWGNVAASCAASFSAFATARPDRRALIADRAELFFATARPELGDAGSLVRDGDDFSWERRSCCLWYLTEWASMCADCSLRPDSARHPTEEAGPR